MRRFVNPTMETFRDVVGSKIYVDKTDLIDFTNSVIDTEQRRICNSRPRRFGKTITARMLESYYSKSFDTEALFSSLEISKSESFKKHLNAHNVIHIDVQMCRDRAVGYKNVADYIERNVIKELLELYGSVVSSGMSLADTLDTIATCTGDKFIIIMDEWDAPIRDEDATESIVNDYYQFLRSLFKGYNTNRFLSLAYLTGILPIKRVNGQSALNEFVEKTMINPGQLDKYIGFTEDEVMELCSRFHRDFNEVKAWYDGYVLGNYHVYNPTSVVLSLLDGSCSNYWSQTSSYNIIKPFIDINYDDTRRAITEMVLGVPIEVAVGRFTNDAAEMKSKNDVLTYLIHLGYLSYNKSNGTVTIPNKEIRDELCGAINDSSFNGLYQMISVSRRILDSTLNYDTVAVGKLIKNIHNEHASTLQYNDENALSHVIDTAYLSSIQYYLKPVRELPAGKGFADLVYVPRPEFIGKYPAMVIELKWDKSVETAISQIKKKEYPNSLQDYTGFILLVGINYNKADKEHICAIEKYDAEVVVSPGATVSINGFACYIDRIRELGDIAGTSYDETVEKLKSGAFPISFVQVPESK